MFSRSWRVLKALLVNSRGSFWCEPVGGNACHGRETGLARGRILTRQVDQRLMRLMQASILKNQAPSDVELNHARSRPSSVFAIFGEGDFEIASSSFTMMLWYVLMLNSLTTRTKSLTTSWSGQNFHPDRRWEKPDGFLAWEHPDAPRNGQPLLWQGLLYVCGGRDEQREPLSSLDLREKHRLLSVLQCFTMVYLVPLSSHMFEKALMIGFLSFKRPLSIFKFSLPVQAWWLSKNIPLAEVWNAWIISRAFGFRLRLSCRRQKCKFAELRWFRSEASGNVIPTRRWSWEMLRREVERLWYVVVVDQDLWYSFDILWYHINPYHHIHLPTSLVSKPGDSRDLTL